MEINGQDLHFLELFSNGENAYEFCVPIFILLYFGNYILNNENHHELMHISEWPKVKISINNYSSKK